MSKSVGNYVSLNMKFFKDIQLLKHNDRTDGIDKSDTFLEEKDKRKNHLDTESTRKFIEAKELAEQDMKNQRKGKRGGKRSFQKNSSTLVDCVIGLGRERTLEIINSVGIEKAHELFDECIQDLADKVNREMGLTFVCANGHFDEGHKESAKENFHYHMSFLNYDMLEHHTVLRKYKRGNLVWSKLQDLTAKAFEPLDYIRGEKDSKAKRLDHKDFRRAREIAEKDIEKDIEKINVQIEKDLTFEELEELKQKYSYSKLLKRIIVYAIRVKKLNEAEDDLEKRSKLMGHIESAVSKLNDNEKLTYEEAELLEALVNNGYVKSKGKTNKRIENVLGRSPKQ